MLATNNIIYHKYHIIYLNMLRYTNHVVRNSVNKATIPVTSICHHSQTPTANPQEATAKKAESKRMAEFKKKLRETTDIENLGEQAERPFQVKDEPFPPWPENTNPHTGEVNGPRGPEPTRYGDWERKGRVSDF